MARFDNDDTFTENAFGIDEGLWSVIIKATKLNAEERYQSAEEMLAALDELSIAPKPVTFPDDELFRPIFKSRGESGSVDPAAEVQSGKEKRGFFARHKRTAAIAGGVAAAAAITVSAVYFANGGFKPKTSEPTSSELTASEPVSSEAVSSETVSSDASSKSVSSDVSSVPEPETPPVPLTETFPYFDEYETKAYYANMNESERDAYKIIYDGLLEGKASIDFPALTYSHATVEKAYYECVYDNPWICNVGSFGYYYEDENKNNHCEPEEFINSIQPEWLQFDMNPNELRRVIEETLSGEGNNIEKLRRVHDAMLYDVSVVARYVTQSCTHAYGSIVYKKADDMGIAQGFCVYAQALGLPCRVIDGTKDGEVRAWCAVKIDETWYNVDVYGDLFAHSDINVSINIDRDADFHTYFLVNDEYLKEMGYVPNGGWEGLGGKEYAADSPYANYYIQCVEGVEEYFSKDSQSAYDRLLKKASEAAESGENEISVCIVPYLINELYNSMNDKFVSDCKEKYGVSLSAFKVKCDTRAYTVTLMFNA